MICESFEVGVREDVIVFNNVTIYDNNYPTEPKKRMELCKSVFDCELWDWKYIDIAPINIDDKVCIGEKSTILKGITTVKGTIIENYSVVTKNVPPYSFITRNSARIIKI